MSDLLRFDLSKNSIGRPIVFGRVGDGESLSMRVQIFKDGAPFDLTGWVATFEGVTHEERTKVFDSDGIEVTNGKNGEFTYTFPNMAFAVAGSYELAYFSFMKDDKRESTDDFEITVYGNADIDAEEAKTIITEYNKLVKALNEAYQSALEKMNTDYDEVIKQIETIKTEMNKLQVQIDKTVNDAEGRISNIQKAVTEAMNKALEELHAADFYTKAESDNKFIPKLSAESGLFVRKNSKISDLNDAVEPGIYSIPAIGVENKPLPNSGSLIVSKDPGGVRQLFQTERTVFIRQFGGTPSSWTDWKEVAFAANVVNLTEPQRIGGTKEFSETPLVNGKEVALKENTYTYKKSGLDEVEAAYRSAFGAETNILLVRKGNKVDAYLRVNVTDVEKLKPNMVQIFKIPKGFMVDQEMRAGYWNTALTTVQYTFPQGNYAALYEEGVKGIRFCSDRKGNHYVCGSWYTADAFPET
ncbi:MULTISPECIES: BppU family phage baseplate upper protein [Enterococcus]|uniref:BppU family phage baseplate upper protein n=1 Tax=Enterococcus TaxID=1350 RepID=UPI00066501D7|nr:BppU family phage baseplate upper protein [Enterococcus faecalis]